MPAVDPKAQAQKERIEVLKSRLTRENYEYIRKEVMLGLNTDLTQLVDQGAFQRFYAFRDSYKDKIL